MPNKCNVYGCRGNYRDEPYSRVVEFPHDEAERNRWIDAMPNERSSLVNLKNIYACAKHFEGEWVTVRGGKRPSQPPSKFTGLGIPQSCLKQIKSPTRSTTSSADARAESTDLRRKDLDKISDFSSFCNTIQKRFSKDHLIKCDADDIYVSKTDPIGRSVIYYLHLKHVKSSFGFLYLDTVEKNGKRIPKTYFSKAGFLKKNSLLSKWSQFNSILSSIMEYEFGDNEYLKCALEELSSMSCCGSPHYQFLYAQLQLLLVPPTGRRFDKNLYILAAELHNISPAAYRMLRKSGSIVLPREELLKKLLHNSLDIENLKTLFNKLKPQQCLVNVLFDEVKLTEALRYSGGRVSGYAQNTSDVEVLATHAMVIEVVCHFGGPKYILSIHPVAKLNSDQLKDILIEALIAIKNAGGIIISCVCDNCNTNVSVYRKLDGPGEVFVPSINYNIFLTYDYVHVFKNIRNNWITEPNKELSFTKEGKTYVALWKDIEALYNEDRQNAIRLTKITYTAVYPKPLQRQSVPFVSQIFNEKTVAGLVALKNKLGVNEGTIILIELIVNWFHMMNVKDRYSGINLRDEYRQPWTTNCSNFKKLYEICDVISSGAWDGGRGRIQKFTKQTADAFIQSTKANIKAAELLLVRYNFEYVLPSVFADEALEKFFGQARQRSGGNFYIDVADVKAAAETKNLHALLRFECIPSEKFQDVPCSSIVSIDDDQFDVTMAETEELVKSHDTMKHKVIYLAGYLEHKYHAHISDVETVDDHPISSDFLACLNRGGLTVPLISTVHFVHSAYKLFDRHDLHCCREHLSQILARIVSPMATIQQARATLSNVLLKAFVLDNSDKERHQGCLRRKEKLSSN